MPLSSGHTWSEGETLAREHAWLDARLAAAFIRAAEGAPKNAALDLTIYRVECEKHLELAEKRLFAALAVLDERPLALERLEWAVNARDVRKALRALDLALTCGEDVAQSGFEAVRRATRRQWAMEWRLLELARQLHAEEEELSPAAHA